MGMLIIEHYEFDRYSIAGKNYTGDITIIDGKVGKWDREDHILYVDNVEELVDAGPEYIIIGTGAFGALNVPNDVQTYIEGEKIKLIVTKTSKACEEFNKLAKQGKKVAAILHGTC
jgi:hypothetical protein